LEARGLLESTLVVLTADHGETLGDADLPVFGHGGLLRPEALEIPLVLFHPQIRAEEFTCTAMNIDTLPTLFTAIGIPLDIPPGQLDGRPLQQGCRETTRSSLAGYGELIAAGLSTPDWQVYHSCKDGATLLYDRAADPENLFPLPILEEPTWPILRGQLTAWIAELDIPGAGLTCPMLPR
jgi:arylsulfatase A-like enzyme